MQIEIVPFPVNALELKNRAILIRLTQAESIAGENVIIGYPREDNKIKKISG
jgi:hypothetical protein